MPRVFSQPSDRCGREVEETIPRSGPTSPVTTGRVVEPAPIPEGNLQRSVAAAGLLPGMADAARNLGKVDAILFGDFGREELLAHGRRPTQRAHMAASVREQRLTGMRVPEVRRTAWRTAGPRGKRESGPQWRNWPRSRFFPIFPSFFLLLSLFFSFFSISNLNPNLNLYV